MSCLVLERGREELGRRQRRRVVGAHLDMAVRAECLHASLLRRLVAAGGQRARHVRTGSRRLRLEHEDVGRDAGDADHDDRERGEQPPLASGSSAPAAAPGRAAPAAVSATGIRLAVVALAVGIAGHAVIAVVVAAAWRAVVRGRLTVVVLPVSRVLPRVTAVAVVVVLAAGDRVTAAGPVTLLAAGRRVTAVGNAVAKRTAWSRAVLVDDPPVEPVGAGIREARAVRGRGLPAVPVVPRVLLRVPTGALRQHRIPARALRQYRIAARALRQCRIAAGLPVAAVYPRLAPRPVSGLLCVASGTPGAVPGRWTLTGLPLVPRAVAPARLGPRGSAPARLGPRVVLSVLALVAAVLAVVLPVSRVLPRIAVIRPVGVTRAAGGRIVVLPIAT